MTRLAEVHARSPRNALAVAAATVVISRRRHPPELALGLGASGFARVVRGI